MLPKIHKNQSHSSRRVHFKDPTKKQSITISNIMPESHRKTSSVTNLNYIFNRSKIPKAVVQQHFESPVYADKPAVSQLRNQDYTKEISKLNATSKFTEYIDKNFQYPSSSTIPNKLSYPGDWNFNMRKVLKRTDSNELDINFLDEEAIMPIRMITKVPSPEVYLPKEADEQFLWREIKASGTETREEASIIKTDSGLIVFGGQNRQKNNEVSQFSLVNLEWKVIPTQYAPKGRTGHTALAYKHKMIIYGGCSEYSSRFAQRRCDKKVNILSLKTLKWQVFEGKGHIPKARRNHCSCRIGKFMVVYGGIDKRSRTLSSCYIYNIKNQTWQYGPIGPLEVSHASLTAIYPASIIDSYTYDIQAIPNSSHLRAAKKGFYLFGGLLSNGKASEALWVLNMAENKQWSLINTQGKPPTARYSHTAGLVKKYLIVYGGRNDEMFASSKELVSDIGLLALDTLTWSVAGFNGKVPRSRWGHCSCTYDNKFIVFGGIDYKQYMTCSIYYMDIELGID